ncbi:MAG: hypothetical protein ACK4NW_02065 [Roseinatronobacter sp.]
MTDHATTRRLRRQRERKHIRAQLAAETARINRMGLRAAVLAAEPVEAEFIGEAGRERETAPVRAKNEGIGE